MNIPVGLPDSSTTSDTSSYTSEVNQYATPSMSLTAIVPSSAVYPAISKHLISTVLPSPIHVDAHLSSWQRETREQRDKPVAQDI